jgi:Anti-sigma-K factor rskA
MLRIRDGGEEHEKYKELSALAASGNLAPLELSELRVHLETCDSCQEVFAQYRILTTEGLPALADSYLAKPGHALWDDSTARDRLFASVRMEQQGVTSQKNSPPESRRPEYKPKSNFQTYVGMAIAAGLLLALVSGAYQFGAHSHEQPILVPNSAALDGQYQQLSEQKRIADQSLSVQEKRLAQLQAESAEKEQALAKLRSSLRALQNRSDELTAGNSQAAAQLKELSQQRDDLNARLQSMTKAYSDNQAELAALRSERDKASLRSAFLESKIEDLTAKTKDQDRRLKDAEQYLSSDRDIRELMGARKLYIADVFDVDGSSRTQKPFGRVFYTQGKSLIFYAFDLDRQPGIVNASTFQVWGQREAPQGEPASPMNLGILYMDNETNRRWVMRLDDPKQLAEIDAVFVTVEPRGGSHKPTSKPFLYALLRNEANHP